MPGGIPLTPLGRPPLRRVPPMPRATRSMLPAGSLEEFLAEPVGHYWQSDGFAYFCPRPLFTALSLFGNPTVDEMRALMRLIDTVSSTLHGARLSWIDATGLVGVAPAVFEMMGQYLAGLAPHQAQAILRQAVVRPNGLVGAAVVGFYEIFRPPYPFRIFTNELDAGRWLGLDADDWRSLDEAFVVQYRALESDASLRYLHDHLSQHLLPGPNLGDAARALALSVRSLQRRLQLLGTTFGAEVRRARVRAAQRMMTATSATLTQIALEVGCATPQHFSDMFKYEVGMTPSKWRAAQACEHGFTPMPVRPESARTLGRTSRPS